MGKQFLPNTHNIHVIKPKKQLPKKKTCSNCLSHTKIKDTHCNPHKKYEWCQYYGKQINPKDLGCEKWS